MPHSSALVTSPPQTPHASSTLPSQSQAPSASGSLQPHSNTSASPLQTPAQSLTASPDTPRPFEGPPEFTNFREALNSITAELLKEDIYLLITSIVIKFRVNIMSFLNMKDKCSEKICNFITVKYFKSFG